MLKFVFGYILLILVIYQHNGNVLPERYFQGFQIPDEFEKTSAVFIVHETGVCLVQSR